MNRRSYSWLGLLVKKGKTVGMVGPFNAKGDAVKAISEQLSGTTGLTGGVFPIELESVVAAQPTASTSTAAAPATPSSTDGTDATDSGESSSDTTSGS